MKSLTAFTITTLLMTANFAFVSQVNAEEVQQQQESAQEQIENSTQPQWCRWSRC